MRQPSPWTPSMLLSCPKCPFGPPPKSCCFPVSVSCSPSPRGPPGIAPVTASKALPEVRKKKKDKENAGFQCQKNLPILLDH